MEPVKLTEIEYALESSCDEWGLYLNTKTGKVDLVEDSVFEFVDEYSELLNNPTSSDEEIEALIEENRLNDLADSWDAKSVRELARYEDGTLIYIEPIDTRDQYRDMEKFIETIEDDQLRSLLYISIDGQGAFRRFKDALAVIGKLQDYYDYQNSRVTEAAKEWCQDNNIPYEE